MVLGQGTTEPDIMVIAEAPGHTEVARDKPLIGRSGQILRKALQGLDVYYTNANICHPEDNKTPGQHEISACQPRLLHEIRVVKPQSILFVGTNAFRGFQQALDLPSRSRLISKVRGPVRTLNLGQFDKVFSGPGPSIPAMITYHPAALLYNPDLAIDFYADIDRLKNHLNGSNPKDTLLYRDHTDVKFLEDADEVATVLENLGSRVAMDLETDSLDFRLGKIELVSLSDTPCEAYVVPWNLIHDRLSNVFHKEMSKRKLVFHNGKFDVKFLRRHGYTGLKVWFDTMLAHTYLDERPGTHSLEQVSVSLLGLSKWGGLVADGVMTATKTRKKADYEKLVLYAGRDADLTYRCCLVLLPKVQELIGWRKADSVGFVRLLHEASEEFTRAELRGIRIDRDKLASMMSECRLEIARVHRRLQKIKVHVPSPDGSAEKALVELNPNSPKIVAHYFFSPENRNINIASVIAKNFDDPSSAAVAMRRLGKTAAETLRLLDDPVALDIIKYRSLNKLFMNYLLRISMHSAVDGRFHPDYRLTGAETGRLSSGGGSPTIYPTGPINIMNIHRTTEDINDSPEVAGLKKQMRSLFVADPGYKMVQVDADALEVRVAAYFCQDPRLIDDCNAKHDLHSIIAIEAFGLDIPFEPWETLKQRMESDPKTKELRFQAKRCVFATLYGASHKKIASLLKIPGPEAKALQQTIFKRYPGFKRWTARIGAQVATTGLVSTPYGRTRRLPIWEFNEHEQWKLVREAINAPIQSTASDIVLDAFCRIGQSAPKIELLAFVHDSILFQVPAKYAEKAAAYASLQISKSLVDSPVRWYSTATIGNSWGELA